MSDETTLLSCPFCGREATISDSALTGEWHVYCDNDCPVRPYIFNKQRAKAIAAWNTRAELGSDDEYEAKMDELLCRLTNGKWSKSRAYSLEFMVSCVDEEYEDAYEKERAELWSGTCEPNWVLQGKTQTQEFWRCECGNCGECFGVESRESFPFKMTVGKVDTPNFCPSCGKAVAR